MILRNVFLRVFIFTLAVCLCNSSSKAQTFTRAYSFACPNGSSDIARGTCIDNTGNYYFCGTFSTPAGGSVDFDPGPGVAPLYANNTSLYTNGFLTRYNQDGTFQWAINVAGSTNNTTMAYNLVTDNTYLYVAWHSNTGTVVSGGTTFTTSSTDMFVAKVRCSDGGIEWVQRYGSVAYTENILNICIDGAGNPYIMGTIPGTDTIGSIALTGPSLTSNVFVAKLNPANGNVVWATCGGGSSSAGTSSSGAIAYHPGTNRIILETTYFGTTASFGGVSFPGTDASQDAMLIELDASNGACVGTTPYGNSVADLGVGIVYDPFTRDVVVSSCHQGNGGAVTMQTGLSVSLTANTSIIIARYHPETHSFVTAKGYSVTPNSVFATFNIKSMASDGKGGIWGAGALVGTLNFNGNSVTTVNVGDFLIVRMNAETEDLEYFKNYGSTGNDGLWDVAIDSVGRMSVAGFMPGTINIDTFVFTSNGTTDPFIGIISTPSVSTGSTSAVTATSATMRGNTLSDGGKTITARGVVYSTSPNPTLASGTDVNMGTGTGTFSQTVTGLSNGTTYYVRAYINVGGVIYYGQQDTFKMVLLNITPSYTLSSPQAISLCRNAFAKDLKPYLHVSDADAAQTLTWTQQSAPSHGTLVITGATAASGSTDRTPGGTITYQPTTGYGGSDAFTIRVSDGISSSDMTFNITVNDLAVTTVVTNVTCNGGNNGSIVATATGGVLPYDYYWSTGNIGRTLSGRTANTYHAIVYDGMGCSVDEPATITQPAALVASISATDISCNGGSNGTATTTVSGGTTPYTYTWSPAAGTLATATGLAAGTYTVTVKDNKNCQTTATATIAEPSAITATTSFTGVSCNDGSNGTASVAASGGTGTLTYSWAPAGGTAATATGLTARTYTVTITDNNSCQLTKTATVTQPTAITASTTKTDISCHGNNDGVATVSASGGTGTLTYSWAPAGGTSTTATGLAGGTYTVTITDDNSCELKKAATIVDPATLTANISAHGDVSCNGGSNGSATVTAGGGTAPYSYSWSPAGGTLASATGLTAGDYTVTVTDAHSCTTTASVTIAEPTLVTASIAGTATICNNTAAKIYLSSENGAMVSYKINGGTTQQREIGIGGIDSVSTGNLTAPATYELVSVTMGACTYPATGSATVSVYPQATVNSISNQTVCNTANTNSVVFDGPVTGTTFTWTNNNTSIGLAASGADSIGMFAAVNTGTVAQTATVTVTPTASGCVGTSRTFTIKVNPTPAITGLPTDQAVCNDDNTTTLSFTANVAGTTYTWTNSNSSIGLATSGTGKILPFTATNSTTDPVTATISVTPKANSCVGATESFSVTVNPTPQLNSSLTIAAICDSSTVVYTPSSATAGTVFTWSRNTPAGISPASNSGTDGINEVLYNTMTNPVIAVYNYTLTANGCSNNQSIVLTVNPTPVLFSTLTPPAVCNNGTFSYNPASLTPGATYQWSRAAVTGISNAANSGINNVIETLTNTTTDPISVTYVYTLSANNCTHIQNVTVTVNPTPVLTTTLTPSAICDNGTFNYVPASATVGTTFAWSRATVTGISNAANTGNDDPNEALHNTTTDPVAVTYVYTLTANSCTNTQNVTVTVNPTPVLSSTLTATPVCNNTLFSYVPTSATTGTTFAWSRATVTGISNAANTGNDDPNETLVNTTSDPVTVTYVYTLTANSCTHTQHVTVVVYPTPVLTSTLTPAAICNNTTFSYTPTSATTGTTYQWSRAVVAGISNTANNGTDDPEEALHNTTANPVAVTYVYTLTANGCTNSQDVTVTVNPTPVLTSTLTAAPICNNTVFNYTPTSATTGTAFSWSRAAVTGISNAANTGNDDPAETLSNTTTDPVVVTYVYTLTANGCTNTQSVDVTVNPTPVLTTTLTAAPVCDSSLFSYDPASATAGTTYQWSRATVAGISNAAGTGIDNPMEYLVNTTPDPINVQYVYTLTANSCTNTQAVTVTVYPKPLLSTTLTPAAICDSTTFAYTPNSLTTGTTYVWSRDVVAGISNPANADNTDPAEVLDNTTVNPVAVTYVYTLTANGCTNTQNVTVTVNPTPVLTSTLTVAPICDSTLFSYVPTSATTGTTFAWSRDTMDNIINPSATGTDNPMEYLVNIAPYPVNVMYTYTLTANGCSHTEAVQMTVNPKPLLSSTLAPVSICDSATFSYVPTSLTSGTTYSWSRAAVTGIANAAGAGTDNPLEVLYNTTADSIAVNYVYTLTAYGCGNTQNVQVYVKPTPKLSSTLSPAAICNSTVFNYTPTSATGGTAFTWTRALVAGISNAAGSGADNPMETLTNTLVNPVNVPYVFSMAAAGCTHSEVVTVRVNPTPKLSSSMTGEVCSTAPFTYSPTSATAGSSYAWTRATAPGISNAAGSGTGNVNEILTNTTLAPKNVTYRYTLTANGCSNIQDVLVTVDPTPQAPVITVTAPANVCAQTMNMNFGAATTQPDTVQYTWSANGAIVWAQGAGHQNAIVSFPEAGNATVVLTANATGFNCTSKDTFAVAVSNATANNAEVYYIHDHFIYTDNTVNTYQWGYDDATTLDSVMFAGQVDQNYFDGAPDFTNKKYWVITTKDGCLSKSYYNAPTGVVNVNSTVAVNLTVVPNPASNYVTISIDGIKGSNDKVELTDLTGKTVMAEAVVNNKAQLGLSNLASGIYVVTYYNNGVKAGTAKLVKE